MFGGRIAEEVFMKQMSTGAGNDFERATKLARDMVTKYGMSDKLGTMVYADENQESFFGAPKAISQATEGFSGAELKAVCVESGMIAIRQDRSVVKHSDVMEAIQRLQKKKSRGGNTSSPDGLYG